MKKRFLSLLLATAMIFSSAQLMGTNFVYASEDSDEDREDEETNDDTTAGNEDDDEDWEDEEDDQEDEDADDDDDDETKPIAKAWTIKYKAMTDVYGNDGSSSKKAIWVGKGKAKTVLLNGITVKGDHPKFKSNNKKVFTVDSKGKVTAKGAGTAKISVTYGNRTKYVYFQCVIGKDVKLSRKGYSLKFTGKSNKPRIGTIKAYYKSIDPTMLAQNANMIFNIRGTFKKTSMTVESEALSDNGKVISGIDSKDFLKVKYNKKKRSYTFYLLDMPNNGKKNMTINAVVTWKVDGVQRQIKIRIKPKKLY